VVVVDTNILVYAWPILYEFMRVTTHRRVMRKPWSVGGAGTFVSTLLASPRQVWDPCAD
jgi:hypothetical protein